VVVIWFEIVSAFAWSNQGKERTQFVNYLLNCPRIRPCTTYICGCFGSAVIISCVLTNCILIVACSGDTAGRRHFETLSPLSGSTQTKQVCHASLFDAAGILRIVVFRKVLPCIGQFNSFTVYNNVWKYRRDMLDYPPHSITPQNTSTLNIKTVETKLTCLTLLKSSSVLLNMIIASIYQVTCYDLIIYLYFENKDTWRSMELISDRSG
jgi:hypothetical protein